jgi:hypothetical protein
MTRGTALLLLLLLPACAETGSQRAFIPRPAAAVAPLVTTPNQSIERERDLADCIERSLREQEDRDEGSPVPAAMPDETARRARRHHGSDHAPVASFN